MKRRTFLAGAGALTAAPVLHALAGTTSGPYARAVRDLAAADGWYADYLSSLWEAAPQGSVVETLADARGMLPDLRATADLRAFDPDAFNGMGGLRGSKGGYFETGPFDALVAPYFLLFAVDSTGIEDVDSPVLIDAGGAENPAVWFSTDNDERMWNVDAGKRNQFANEQGRPMVVGLLVNGKKSEIWVDGIKTAIGVEFGAEPLAQLRLLNDRSSERPLEGAALPPLIYKGVPADAVVSAMFETIMSAAGIALPHSAFRLLGRSNPLPARRVQGIAFDGTDYYLADSFEIYRLTRDGDTYTVTFSREVRDDAPEGKRQINGLDVHGGFLWAGINNFNREPRRGWLAQYRLSDLSLVGVHELDPWWNEGGAWRESDAGDEYWAIYHDVPRAARYAWDGERLEKIDDYLLPIAEGRTDTKGQRGLYQSAQWLGDMLITQTHVNNGTPMTHFHRWTGEGFEAAGESFAFTNNLGQGLHWETEGEVMLFACRSVNGPQTIVRAAYEGI